MEEIINKIAGLTLDGSDDVTLICGSRGYIVDRASLAKRSVYFAIACYTDWSLKEGSIIFPDSKQRHIEAMMHWMQYNTYDGPRPNPTHEVPSWERNGNLRAGEENGMTIEFCIEDLYALQYFPGMTSSYIVHGDAAIKACKLITHHELFAQSRKGLQCIGLNDYLCHPNRLPLPIQNELYPYLTHLRTRNPKFSPGPVFHAQMFRLAVKYMLDTFKPHIVSTFRDGARPWMNTSLFTDSSFLQAINLICTPHGWTDDGEHWEMAKALIEVMGSNWGWIRWDEPVKSFLEKRDFKILLDVVVMEFERLKRGWKHVLKNGERADKSI